MSPMYSAVWASGALVLSWPLPQKLKIWDKQLAISNYWNKQSWISACCVNVPKSLEFVKSGAIKVAKVFSC